MDFNALSDQQLQIAIFLFGFGAMFFAAVFGFSMLGYMRKANKKTVSQSPPKDKPPSWFATNLGLTKGPSEMEQSPQSPKKKGLLKSSSPKISPNPPREESAPAPKQAPVKNPNDKAPRELMRLWVDPESKGLIVEVNGKQFTNIRQVRDKAIGQRILEVTGLLLQFTGGLIATAAGVKTLPKPEAKLSHLPPAPEPDPEPAVTPDLFDEAIFESPASSPQQPEAAQSEHDAFAWPDDSAPAEATEAPAPVPPPAPKPERDMSASAYQPYRSPYQNTPESESRSRGFFGFGGGGKKADEPQEVPALNLADEIDRVVQKKLAAENESTPVKISSAPGGMIAIRVGAQKFSAVDEVQPPHIKNLIQAAIRDWERST